MENKLIILLVIILGAIAIAQLVRVYELSSKMRKSGEHEVNSRDNNLNGKMMLGFMFFQFLGFIYLMFKYGWTGRGVAASVQGQETDWLLNLNFVIVILIFFFTNFLLFYFAYKYVKKPGVPAFYYPHNNKLEMLWTVVPACVLAVIIILGLKSWNNLTSLSKDDAIRVELFSEQFKWTARYAGQDNILGKYDYKLTSDNNELALMTSNTIDSSIRIMIEGPSGIKSIQKVLNKRDTILSDSITGVLKSNLSRRERLLRLLVQMKNNHSKSLDKNAWDDIIQKDTLVLCKGKEYEFNFRSKDVIHSAFFLHFRAQINTVPGMTTRTKFKPIYTTEEMRKLQKNPKFNYILMCNKICGGAHYKMNMIIVVKSESQYKAWMASKAKETFKDKYFPIPVAEATTPAAADTTMKVVNN
jgi:cytochrome c oxidase subunit 2